MENRELAIQIKGLKKKYRLGQIGGGSLQRDIQSWWARIRGKEDPNSKIGAGQRSNGKTFMALNGIDMTVYKGEALGIIGHNGAGKSTLLKLLSRVTAPTEGEIGMNGRVASMLEVGTGFNGEMTGRENVYMNGTILGMSKAEIDAKMEQIIEFSEIGEFIDTPAKRYSSGMYVKLAFSVAAHLDSEIMIMDEVLAVGDMAFQKKCLDKMREVATKEGRTVLYVSHNMNTIRQLCDRCVVLDKGKVAFVGDVEEAINIYLDITKAEVKQVYDLSIANRDVMMGKKIGFKRLEFVDYYENLKQNKLRYKITISGNVSEDNLFIRSTFHFSDKTPIGTSVSENIGHIDANQERTVLMEIDLSQFPSGEYDFTLYLDSISSFGHFSYDCIWGSIPFEVVNDTPLKWSHKFFGHVCLKPIHYVEG